MNGLIKEQIKTMSLSEKILLVEEIWDSIAEENESFELSETQIKAVKDRSSDYHKNPKLGRDWEEIRKEFFGK